MSSKRAGIFLWLSAAACALSLHLQILYTNGLVNHSDWSALQDTHFAVAALSGILITVTAALNLFAVLLVYGKKSVPQQGKG